MQLARVTNSRSSVGGRAAGAQLHTPRSLVTTRSQRASAASSAAPASAEATRRELLRAAVAVPLALHAGLALPRRASAGEGGGVYVDSSDRFSIAVPTGWEAGSGFIGGASGFTGATGARRTLAWFPAGRASETNVTVTITNTSYEFTKLGSFGTPFAFGQNLVNSMDRSYMKRMPDGEPMQVARLVDAREERGMYAVEYTVEREGAPARHLLSLVALGYNGVNPRLYTVTAQCLEQDVGTDRAILEQVLSSFAPPGARTV